MITYSQEHAFVIVDTKEQFVDKVLFAGGRWSSLQELIKIAKVALLVDDAVNVMQVRQTGENELIVSWIDKGYIRIASAESIAKDLDCDISKNSRNTLMIEVEELYGTV